MNPLLKMAMPAILKMLPKQVEKLEKFLIEKVEELEAKQKPEGHLTLIIFQRQTEKGKKFFCHFSDTSPEGKIRPIGEIYDLHNLLMGALTNIENEKINFDDVE
jgi:hypothetical protein